MKNIADLRENYTKGTLLEQHLNSNNPFELFDIWWEQALQSEHEANAMVLSSIDFDENNQPFPHSRVVLLKDYNEYGFVFFTNYQSDKSHQMEQCPNVCLNFHWHQLERQVRIEGTVTKISQEESQKYFFSRPKSSQLGAWTSPQSQVIANRDFLEQQQEELSQKFANEIPYPEHWGGWIVMPHRIEFWQGRPSRLHDRINYVKNNIQSDWHMMRLAP